MATKVFPVQGVCSKINKKFCLQLVNANVDYTIEGFTKVSAGAVAPSGESPEMRGDVKLSKFGKLGCPYCKQKHLYVCPHCQQFICYDGNASTTKCPVCGKDIQVPASDGINVTWARKPASNRNILMLFDVSGSMSGSRIVSAKRAAVDSYLSKIGSDDRVMIAGFGFKPPEEIRVLSDLTNDKRCLTNIINSLEATWGTPQPITAVLNRADFAPFRNASGPKIVLFFTDGEWSGDLEVCKRDSRTLKDMGYVIIGIGTAGASRTFLDAVCSQGASFMASGNNFSDSFEKAFKISFGQ